jgi:hypothetical protein
VFPLHRHFAASRGARSRSQGLLYTSHYLEIDGYTSSPPASRQRLAISTILSFPDCNAACNMLGPGTVDGRPNSTPSPRADTRSALKRLTSATRRVPAGREPAHAPVPETRKENRSRWGHAPLPPALLRLADGHGRGTPVRRGPGHGALDPSMRSVVREARAPGRGEDGDTGSGGGGYDDGTNSCNHPVGSVGRVSPREACEARVSTSRQESPECRGW